MYNNKWTLFVTAAALLGVLATGCGKAADVVADAVTTGNAVDKAVDATISSKSTGVDKTYLKEVALLDGELGKISQDYEALRTALTAGTATDDQFYDQIGSYIDRIGQIENKFMTLKAPAEANKAHAKFRASYDGLRNAFLHFLAGYEAEDLSKIAQGNESLTKALAEYAEFIDLYKAMLK